MTSTKFRKIARQAESMYATQLKAMLEPVHAGEYVAVEPVSGEYSLSGTLTAAIAGARRAHPDRVGYAMRIGSRVAGQLGAAARRSTS